MSQIIPALPDVQIVGGIPKTTSLNVARVFGKEHRNVVQSLQRLDCSAEFRQLNFQPANYLDAQGKPRPMVEMTRDGFTFLVMGFTGKEAARWKETYIGLFNALAEEVARPKIRSAPPAPQPETITLTKDEYIALQAEKIELLQAKLELVALKPQPKPKKPAPVPVTQEKRARIIALLAEGLGKTEIGRRVGVSSGSVYMIARELRAGGAA